MKEKEEGKRGRGGGTKEEEKEE